MTKEELKQFNKELDEREKKVKRPTSKLEELEKEADKYATEVKESSPTADDWLAYEYAYNGYMTAAKPRDEIIDRLSKRCLKLEKQLDVMKTCNNCKNQHILGCYYNMKSECNCTTKVKWRLCK